MTLKRNSVINRLSKPENTAVSTSSLPVRPVKPGSRPSLAVRDFDEASPVHGNSTPTAASPATSLVPPARLAAREEFVIADNEVSPLALIDDTSSDTPKKPKRVRNKNATLEFTLADRKMLMAIRNYGRLTGNHPPLACDQTYANKKARITQLERYGLISSKLAYGIKFYGLTAEGVNRLMLGIDSEEFLEGQDSETRIHWRHSLLIATQALLFSTKNAWGKVIGNGYAPQPLPVIPEWMLKEAAEGRDPKIARASWRGDWKEVLEDPRYPVIDVNTTGDAVLSEADFKAIEDYWESARQGYAASLFTHWDDEGKFGGKVRANSYVAGSHRRRPDFIIPLPHIRQADGTVVGGSAAVEVEVTRKSVDEYVRIITQWFDHPGIHKLYYLTNQQPVATALGSAKRRIVESGKMTQEELDGFLSIFRPVILNEHLDAEGYFG